MPASIYQGGSYPDEEKDGKDRQREGPIGARVT